jgi:hypothetical protein
MTVQYTVGYIIQWPSEILGESVDVLYAPAAMIAPGSTDGNNDLYEALGESTGIDAANSAGTAVELLVSNWSTISGMDGLPPGEFWYWASLDGATVQISYRANGS